MNTTEPSVIAPQILVFSILMTLAWATHLIDTIHDYVEARDKAAGYAQRRRGDLVVAFRRLVVAFCLCSISIAYVVRTGLVLAGLGEVQSGQIVFFALLGTNVTGAIFTVVSRKFD